jgi:hypothetical protein
LELELQTGLPITFGSLAMCWFRKHKTVCYHKYKLNALQVMASANKKFTPLKKCACSLHEPQHIARVLLGKVFTFLLSINSAYRSRFTKYLKLFSLFEAPNFKRTNKAAQEFPIKF